jgi:hypothetical protein
MQEVTAAALDLARATDAPIPRPLPDIGLIPTGVRTDDVYDELTDRLARLRQRAWDLVQSPDRSVGTLRDYATIGIAAHAAAFHTGPLGPASTSIARARSWQGLSTHLAALVSPAPNDDVVHADLTALSNERDPRRGRPARDRVRRQERPNLHHHRSHPLHSRPLRVSTGDEITDNPVLARARLDGGLAPAPERTFDAVTRLYQGLRSRPEPVPARGPAPTLTAANRTAGVEPVGMQVDA